MLTKIGLTNFKCFQQITVGCTSLNLLCGLNGMGKSSVIQAMLVLRQSFEDRGTRQRKVGPWRSACRPRNGVRRIVRGCGP